MILFKIKEKMGGRGNIIIIIVTSKLQAVE